MKYVAILFLMVVHTASLLFGQSKAEFSAQYNGKRWEGSGGYNSHLYYTNGNKIYQTTDPVLILSFRSTQSPDSRTLLITIKNIRPHKSTVPQENIEILFSGAETGKPEDSKMFGFKPNNNKGPIAFQITKWKNISAAEAKISGTLSGKLDGIFTKGAVEINSGKFQDVIVKVFNE